MIFDTLKNFAANAVAICSSNRQLQQNAKEWIRNRWISHDNDHRLLMVATMGAFVLERAGIHIDFEITDGKLSYRERGMIP